jgi:hypothetical protein
MVARFGQAIGIALTIVVFAFASVAINSIAPAKVHTIERQNA